MDEKVQALQSLRKLEKALQGAKSALQQQVVILDSLQRVYALLKELEGLVEENAIISNQIKGYENRRQLLGLYKDVHSQMKEFRRQLQEIEQDSTRADLFLENFRDYRVYSFQEGDSARKFVQQAFDVYGLQEAFYKPEFLGMINMDEIARQLKLEKVSPQVLKVPKDKIAEFLQQIALQNALRKSKLEGKDLKFSFHDAQTLALEADNSAIRRMDRLCKECGGNYSEF